MNMTYDQVADEIRWRSGWARVFFSDVTDQAIDVMMESEMLRYMVAGESAHHQQRTGGFCMSPTRAADLQEYVRVMMGQNLGLTFMERILLRRIVKRVVNALVDWLSHSWSNFNMLEEASNMAMRLHIHGEPSSDG